MSILVIGGANIDLIGASSETFNFYDSNPGVFYAAHGGVGRNIVENLARLGHAVTFITILGEDDYGKAIKKHLEAFKVNVVSEEAPRTSSYLALFNPEGELQGAVASMEAMERLDRRLLEKHETLIKEAKYCILDTNLNNDALDYLFGCLEGRIYVDAISVTKAKKLRPYLARIDTLKCNKLEADALAGEAGLSLESLQDYFTLEGVRRTFITDGRKGAYMLSKNHLYMHQALKADVVNTSGAGDAFLAGIIDADITHINPLANALSMAALTVKSKEAVNQTLTKENLRKLIRSEYHDD